MMVLIKIIINDAVHFINVFDRDFRKFNKQLDSVKLLSVIENFLKLSCKFDTHLKFYFYFEKKSSIFKKLKNWINLI